MRETHFSRYVAGRNCLDGAARFVDECQVRFVDEDIIGGGGLMRK